MLPLYPSSSRARPRLPLLASLPSRELEQRLVERGGTPSQARSAVGRLRAFLHGPASALEPRWDASVFKDLGIGSWAHAALLELDPRLSLEIAERAPAGDGVERLLLRARDGALLETVLIPGPSRTTVCISSQVGCARACSFCETGALGLTRQLDAGEMVDQVRLARALWGDKFPPLSNVVFMGMGEPFDNLGEVARATHVLTDDRGLKLSPSRVTVSTVGVADKIGAFFESCRAELAVSLNAPDDARRSAIMPVNQRFDMGALRAAIAAHLPRGHKVLFEYVLIGGFNDAVSDAELVADYVRDLRARVNVIPVNPGPDPSIRPPSPASVDAFVGRLAARGVTTLVRRPRGRDVGGACGQLAGARRLELGASA